MATTVGAMMLTPKTPAAAAAAAPSSSLTNPGACAGHATGGRHSSRVSCVRCCCMYATQALLTPSLSLRSSRRRPVAAHSMPHMPIAASSRRPHHCSASDVRCGALASHSAGSLLSGTPARCTSSSAGSAATAAAHAAQSACECSCPMLVPWTSNSRRRRLVRRDSTAVRLPSGTPAASPQPAHVKLVSRLQAARPASVQCETCCQHPHSCTSGRRGSTWPDSRVLVAVQLQGARWQRCVCRRSSTYGRTWRALTLLQLIQHHEICHCQ